MKNLKTTEKGVTTPRTAMIPFVFVGLLGVTLLAFPAFAQGISPSVRDMKARHDDLAQKIRTMVQDVSCDEDLQCAVVGFGHRPCGGFEAFFVYSTKNTDEATLWRYAHDYQILDSVMKRGLVGICEVLQPPHVSCVNHQCVAGNPEQSSPLDPVEAVDLVEAGDSAESTESTESLDSLEATKADE